MISRKALTAIIAIVAVVASVLLVTRHGSSDRTLTAYFSDASPLETGSEVRIDGVKVGTVKSIQLDGKSAKVELTVQKQVLPLHQGARLEIKPINVLGENYVSITDGRAAAPYDDSTTIPLARTSSAVNLQDVLNTFNDPTSTGLATMVATLGDGLTGNGAKAAQAIRALAPTMDHLDQLGAIIRNQNGVLADLIDKATPVAASMRKNDGRDLDLLIRNAQATLAALGDNQQAIRQTIAQLPTTLVEARRTLNDLGKVSDSVSPTLRAARPVTAKLSTISDEIVHFSKYATPAFQQFGPLLAHADALIRAARPVAADLSAHAVNLRRTAVRTKPVGYQLLHAHLKDLMDFVTKWALSTNGRDALSHYFRGVVFVTPDAINTLLGNKILPNVGAIQPKLKNPTSGLTGATQKTVKGLLGGLSTLLGGKKNPSATSAPTQGSGPLSGLLSTLLGAKHRTARSATGLTSPQEKALLQQLIGGR